MLAEVELQEQFLSSHNLSGELDAAMLPEYWGWWFYPIDGGNMERVNLPVFYHFGEAVRTIKQLQHSGAYGELINPLFLTQSWLDSFLEATSEMAFPHSREAAQDLLRTIGEGIEFLENLVSQEALDHLGLDKIQSDNVRKRDYLSKLKRAVRDFEFLFHKEAARVSVFSITRKGIYDTQDLIERPHYRFSEKIRNLLPPQTLYDFHQAGKCLAYEVPTAAAFHTLRGTEALMIKYYEVLAGHEWDLRQRDWGAYIRELRSINADARITDRLDEIRRFERNPILHPQANIEPDKALPLFEMVGGVVVLMVEEIEKLEAAKAAASSPPSP